jgi:asparagine synthase (glutamine-hydrolysing)
MCGICGEVGGGDAERPLERALRRLDHRGPDHSAARRVEGCALGHTRLSVIDLAPRAHQPMYTADEQLMVVFNGEIYNHRRLRSELEGAGHSFRTQSDTEVLLHGYRQWGDALLQRIEGMYAFALWDVAKRRLLAARDPLGKKPFVWHFDGQCLRFASEIGALVAELPQRPSIDLDAVEAYLRYRYVPGNTSVYEGVRKLPPGHFLTFDLATRNEPQIARHWDPQTPVDPRMGTSEAVERLDSLLVEAVGKRLESDVPTAALLSGGLDSSLIVAVAAQKLGVQFKTVHAHFSGDREGERDYARQVADLCGSQHEEVEISSDRATALPQVLSAFSEPYADDSALPSYYVYEALKRHATVAITGDGGDEIFAGYLHARGFYWRDKWGRWPLLAWGAGGIARCVPGYRRYKTLRHAVSLGNYLGLPGERAFALTRSTAWNEDARGLLRHAAESDSYLERAFGGAVADSDLHRMLAADRITTLPDAYLLKVDRTSMAHGVEARCPLLDQDLLQTAQQIPGKVLMAAGATKALQRKVAEAYLPHEIIYRPKRGFSMPLASFLRGGTDQMIARITASEHSFTQRYFDGDFWRRRLAAFAAGRDELAYQLWSVLCLEIWYRLHYQGDISSDTPLGEVA